ncbi:hypothetical protein O0I10_002033 [Lichtheimia ornata]|uniref:CCHC-type domain-containing protein n=1 Tax=Lichtheimia ornata TaxID=688661 RepID=A0AAD7VB37_9FUNG|nr:uncharacterized protein O0I10_002033 [Lichtheimia ornata]KAJ8662339.1 hypothetical protein O0I10_002033 [Lichtheimia ornata]
MSSANSIKSPDKETGTQSSTPPISYARAARVQRPTAIRESLTSNALDKTTHSNVWKVGGSPASCPSLFFDFTSRTENRSTLLRHISESYPDNCGARLHSDHSRRIVELFIDDSSLYEKACKNGLHFSDGSRILPTRPLSENAHIINIRLSNLPFTSREKLADGIRQALAPFGKILDHSILRDQDSHLFMGHGYATLNVSASLDFLPLTHTIAWPNSADFFYATWAEMPLHCLHCHRSGHSISSCPSHPSRNRLCWSCGQPGHRAAKCSYHRTPAPTNNKEPHVPPSPPSPTLSSAHSHDSDVSMHSDDLSNREAHNDQLIVDFIPPQLNTDPNAKPITGRQRRLLNRLFPISDEARTITETLTSVSYDRLYATLRHKGKAFPFSFSFASESVSSSSHNDPV